MVRNIKTSKGVVVPLTDLALETSRNPATVLSLARRLKMPLVQAKVKSLSALNGRKLKTYCVEPKNVPTLLSGLMDLRRYKVPRNGHSKPVEVPVTRRPFPREAATNEAPAAPTTRHPMPEIAGIDRSYLLDLFSFLHEKGLDSLHFEGKKLRFATRPVEEEITIR